MYSRTTRPAATQATVRWRFVLVFAAVYAALYLGYSAVPDSFLRDNVYFYAMVCPAKAIINWATPAERVTGTQNRLESPAARLNIVRGCDGSGVEFLLVAAIIALRARPWRTFWGIIGAVALVYVLNQLRIIALYFVDTYQSTWFTPLHVYFIPTLMILAATIYFAAWAEQGTHVKSLPAQA